MKGRGYVCENPLGAFLGRSLIKQMELYPDKFPDVRKIIAVGEFGEVIYADRFSAGETNSDTFFRSSGQWHR